MHTNIHIYLIRPDKDNSHKTASAMHTITNNHPNTPPSNPPPPLIRGPTPTPTPPPPPSSLTHRANGGEGGRGEEEGGFEGSELGASRNTRAKSGAP